MTTELGNLIDYIDQFQRRIVQDAINEASSAYWSRRAADLRHARPRPGDFTGQATRTQLAAATHALDQAALACDRAAQLALNRHDQHHD